jgi:hypothetical protein
MSVRFWAFICSCTHSLPSQSLLLRTSKVINGIAGPRWGPVHCLMNRGKCARILVSVKSGSREQGEFHFGEMCSGPCLVQGHTDPFRRLPLPTVELFAGDLSPFFPPHQRAASPSGGCVSGVTLETTSMHARPVMTHPEQDVNTEMPSQIHLKSETARTTARQKPGKR